MALKNLKISPWRIHKANWDGCTRCSLCEGRQKVILFRGQVPCDVLFVGEAPGQCIDGSSLIETAYRDVSKYPFGIPIRDLVGKSGFYVYSYHQGQLKLGLVKKVWRTGIKKLYEVRFFWWGAKKNGGGGRQKYFGSIRVTDNHPFLLKSGEYRSIRQGLTTGNRLQPFYRRGGEYSKVGVSSGSLKLESRLLMEHKIGRELESEEEVHHDDRNKLNNTEKNLILLNTVEHARLHGVEDNVMFNPIHRQTHQKAVGQESYRKSQSQRMSSHLADPVNRQKRIEQIHKQREQTATTVRDKFASDPQYYYNYLQGHKHRWRKSSSDDLKIKFHLRFPDVEYPPTENHQIYSIEPVGMDFVYDMEVENYHNFVANGVVVHNSEDVLGIPFAGPAGHLLDDIIKSAMPIEVAFDELGEERHDPKFQVGFTDLVGCIPIGDDGNKVKEPPDEAIRKCSPRLLDLVRISKPKLVVTVGKLATKWCEKILFNDPESNFGAATIEIVHPAAILRAESFQQGLLIQQATIALRDAFGELE